MKCEMACHLIDDYLENRLSRRDRQLLETHLAVCSSCAEELRQRPAFEHSLWRALASSVHHMQLSSEASSRLVQAAQNSVRRGIWSKRAVLTIQLMAGATTVVLLVVGMLVLLGRISLPAELPVLPRSSTSRPAISLTRNDILVEPWDLHPGEAFTATILLHSHLSEPVDAVRFRLDISGPTGDYSFVLAVQGPFPAESISVLQVTPALLATPCREQYQISPADIVRVPGVYTLRATLLSPVVMPEK
jgi:hypothetical protein